MEFSRQEYWNGLLFLSPVDLPNPGIDPGSLALQVDSFYHLSHQGPTQYHEWVGQKVLLGFSDAICKEL